MSEEILYPAGEEQKECAICGNDLYQPLSSTYPNLVCEECDQKAVNEDGENPVYGHAYREKLKSESDDPESVNVPSDAGENPVFIDGHKCWRRYKFGGYITRLDQFDCDTLREFVARHRTDER
jgi:hypothetical protein